MYSTPLIAVAFFISFEKKLGKSLALSQKLHTFANAITKVMHFGSLAQLNRASDYGSEGCRFESCRARQTPSSLRSSGDGVFPIPKACSKPG